MWLGIFLTRLNMGLGILYILIYITAIAVVLISTIVLVGASLKHLTFRDLLIIYFLPYFLFVTVRDPSHFLIYPYSNSSIGMHDVASNLLSSNIELLICATLYFFLIGFIITNVFKKTLYKRATLTRPLTTSEDFSLSLH